MIRVILEILIIIVALIFLPYVINPTYVLGIFNQVNPFPAQNTTTTSIPIPASGTTNIYFNNTEQRATINAANNTVISVGGQHNSILVNIAPNAIIYLVMSGGLNIIALRGGYVVLYITGSQDSVQLSNTIVISTNIQGRGNQVYNATTSVPH